VAVEYIGHQHREGAISRQQVNIKFDGTSQDAEQLKQLFEEFVTKTGLIAPQVETIGRQRGNPTAQTTIVAVVERKHEVKKKMVAVEELHEYWECTNCGIRLTDAKVARLRCYACGAYLFNDEEGFSDLGALLQRRAEIDSITAEFDNPKRPVVFYDAKEDRSSLLVVDHQPTDHPRAQGFVPPNVAHEDTV
jgi:hypothetical protein